MIKVKRTYRGYCCNSCGKCESETFPVQKIEIGIPSFVNGEVIHTTSISLCNVCLKELQTKIEEFI